MNKRILALLLALVMAVGALPTGAWAADTEEVSDANVKVAADGQWETTSQRASNRKAKQKKNVGGTPTKTQSQKVEMGEDGLATMESGVDSIQWNISYSDDSLEYGTNPEPAELYTGEDYCFNVWWPENITVTRAELFIKWAGETGYGKMMDHAGNTNDYNGDCYYEYISTAGTMSYYWRLTYQNGTVRELNITSATVSRGYNYIYGLYKYYDEEDDYYKKEINYSTKEKSIKLGLDAEDGNLKYKSNNKKIKVDKNGKVTITKKYAGIGIITITAPETKDYLGYYEEMWIFVFPKKPTIKKLTSPKKGQLKVTWGKVTPCDKYFIGYRQGNGNWKKLTVSKKKTSALIKGLKSKKKYTVSVTAYLENKSGSCWNESKYKTIKVK